MACYNLYLHILIPLSLLPLCHLPWWITHLLWFSSNNTYFMCLFWPPHVDRADLSLFFCSYHAFIFLLSSTYIWYASALVLLLLFMDLLVICPSSSHSSSSSFSQPRAVLKRTLAPNTHTHVRACSHTHPLQIRFYWRCPEETGERSNIIHYKAET